jgi:hypothetical protein
VGNRAVVLPEAAGDCETMRFHCWVSGCSDYLRAFGNFLGGAL